MYAVHRGSAGVSFGPQPRDSKRISDGRWDGSDGEVEK